MSNIVELARKVVEADKQWRVCDRDFEVLKDVLQQAKENHSQAVNALGKKMSRILVASDVAIAEAILDAYEEGVELGKVQAQRRGPPG